MKEYVAEGQDTLKNFTDNRCAPASFCFRALLKAREIRVNGQKVSADVPLKAGDTVRYYLTPAQERKRGFTVVYEDENVLVADKDDGVNSEAVFSAVSEAGERAVRSCEDCGESTCSTNPHVIRFNERWEASCPVCRANGRRGRIKPVQARTFATYLRAAWDFRHDGGRAFCNNLGQEAKKVAAIKEILDNDNIGDGE